MYSGDGPRHPGLGRPDPGDVQIHQDQHRPRCGRLRHQRIQRPHGLNGDATGSGRRGDLRLENQIADESHSHGCLGFRGHRVVPDRHDAMVSRTLIRADRTVIRVNRGVIRFNGTAIHVDRTHSIVRHGRAVNESG